MNLCRQGLAKVPEITVYFWIIKVLTTAMGESTSDYFVFNFDPVVVVAIAAAILAAVLAVQLTRSRYVGWVYRLATTSGSPRLSAAISRYSIRIPRATAPTGVPEASTPSSARRPI